ncbi:MAG: hypothetical protein HYZ74_03765 [Elusimicrobia bacterium]|nr:hypothetical protein [Elusimicrobiota bacterium]
MPRARRGALGTLVGSALALGLWNVRMGLKPQSLLENNVGYRQAMFVRDHTVPSSWIIISGIGSTTAKVYLPNFAQRTREALEYYFDRNPKDQALKLLSDFIARQTENGIPLYVLSDVVEDERVQRAMFGLWGVTMAEIQAAFGPGRMIRMAAGQGVGVYLYVPQARQPELFTVLGYSVLTESDMGRIGESVTALKTIAAEMTSDERRRAAELMGASGWGFDLLWRGFSPYMSPERRKAVREKGERFAQYQKTPDFWLRAGNLYKFLGRKAEVIDAWSRAYKLSGNAALLRDIEAARKSK